MSTGSSGGDAADAAPSPAHSLFVVMGVSAAGKSSVSAALSARWGIDWIDADALHPRSNVEKMAAGLPLDDDDRWPWLDEVGRRLAEAEGGLIVACSALRRVYRDRIGRRAPVAFLHLSGSPETLRRRAEARTGHFMPPSLLDSQIALLEPLDADERGTTLRIDGTIDDIVVQASEWAGRG